MSTDLYGLINCLSSWDFIVVSNDVDEDPELIFELISYQRLEKLAYKYKSIMCFYQKNQNKLYLQDFLDDLSKEIIFNYMNTKPNEIDLQPSYSDNDLFTVSVILKKNSIESFHNLLKETLEFLYQKIGVIIYDVFRINCSVRVYVT